ncbi:unnamed protein product, partial [Ectocarpus sp. 13 AM-2016]
RGEERSDSRGAARSITDPRRREGGSTPVTSAESTQKNKKKLGFAICRTKSEQSQSESVHQAKKTTGTQKQEKLLVVFTSSCATGLCVKRIRTSYKTLHRGSNPYKFSIVEEQKEPMYHNFPPPYNLRIYMHENINTKCHPHQTSGAVATSCAGQGYITCWFTQAEIHATLHVLKRSPAAPTRSLT